MSKVIEGVPEFISRDDYIRLIESVGLDPDLTNLLVFEVDGVRAHVDVLDGNGQTILAPTAEDEFALAQHEIFIPVYDEVPA